jgi:hypothetical protein
MKRNPLFSADDRPRIHVWANRYGFEASVGPCGARHRGSLTLGEAIEAAFSTLDQERVQAGAVIIVEPREASR